MESCCSERLDPHRVIIRVSGLVPVWGGGSRVRANMVSKVSAFPALV